MLRNFAAALAATLALAGPALAGDQDFTLINGTGHTINEVYVSPSAVDDWEEDVLGRDALPDGARTTIRFDRSADACLWDLRVVYTDGETADWAGFNLCEISVIAIEYDDRTGETSAQYE